MTKAPRIALKTTAAAAPRLQTNEEVGKAGTSIVLTYHSSQNPSTKKRGALLPAHFANVSYLHHSRHRHLKGMFDILWQN
jgi:hypothetical protein